MAFADARFPVDSNSNGVVDMPESPEYAQAPMKITVDARELAKTYPSIWPYENRDAAGFGSTTGPWRWTFSSEDPASMDQDPADLNVTPSNVAGLASSNTGGRIVIYTQNPVISLDLYEGKWNAELARVDAAGNAIYWKTFRRVFSDVVIVQGGDSYSSGEGAPDRPRSEGFWGDDGTGSNGHHRSAHRSSLTWGSVYAQDLSGLASIGTLFGADTVTTVTYINIAESGALIDDLDGQLSRLSTILGPRKVDQFLLSIGGNDAGFSQAIASYMIREPVLFGNGLLGPSFDDIEDAIRTGNWVSGKFTDVGSILVEVFDFAIPSKFSRVRGFNDLRDGYRHVHDLLKSMGITPEIVRILQYPDPLVPFPGDPNGVCPEPILTSVSSVLGRNLEIGRAEQRHARDELIIPLNTKIASAAAEWGWKVVAAEKVMYAHAICQDNRMTVRYQESLDTQGDNRGALHPNADGHRAIASAMFDAN